MGGCGTAEEDDPVTREALAGLEKSRKRGGADDQSSGALLEWRKREQPVSATTRWHAETSSALEAGAPREDQRRISSGR